MGAWGAKAQGATVLMYTPWDIMVRELGGGVWFWTSLWLVVAFLAYIFRQLSFEGKIDRNLVYAAMALTVYFMGSTIRGFLTWMQFFYAGNGWNPDIWISTWPWFGTSVIFNVAGAALCIWLLSTWRWRLMFTVCAVTGSFLIPTMLRLLV